MDNMTYYAYNRSTCIPSMSASEYLENIENTDLIPRNGYTTYCNIWAQNVMKKCNVPFPAKGCTKTLELLTDGYDNWVHLDNDEFKNAQAKANAGFATIAITSDHVVVVTPNDGSVPSVIGEVFVSQSGWDCFYGEKLSYAWKPEDRGEIQFFYYCG